MGAGKHCYTARSRPRYRVRISISQIQHNYRGRGPALRLPMRVVPLPTFTYDSFVLRYLLKNFRILVFQYFSHILPCVLTLSEQLRLLMCNNCAFLCDVRQATSQVQIPIDKPIQFARVMLMHILPLPMVLLQRWIWVLFAHSEIPWFAVELHHGRGDVVRTRIC